MKHLKQNIKEGLFRDSGKLSSGYSKNLKETGHNICDNLEVASITPGNVLELRTKPQTSPFYLNQENLKIILRYCAILKINHLRFGSPVIIILDNTLQEQSFDFGSIVLDTWLKPNNFIISLTKPLEKTNPRVYLKNLTLKFQEIELNYLTAQEMPKNSYIHLILENTKIQSQKLLRHVKGSFNVSLKENWIISCIKNSKMSFSKQLEFSNKTSIFI